MYSPLPDILFDTPQAICMKISTYMEPKWSQILKTAGAKVEPGLKFDWLQNLADNYDLLKEAFIKKWNFPHFD